MMLNRNPERCVSIARFLSSFPWETGGTGSYGGGLGGGDGGIWSDGVLMVRLRWRCRSHCRRAPLACQAVLPAHTAPAGAAREHYSPAIVMFSISHEPVRMCERRSTSLPTATRLVYMSRRLAAMVISSTG